MPDNTPPNSLDLDEIRRLLAAFKPPTPKSHKGGKVPGIPRRNRKYPDGKPKEVKVPKVVTPEIPVDNFTSTHDTGTSPI